jgi:hypothetical protein
MQRYLIPVREYHPAPGKIYAVTTLLVTVSLYKRLKKFCIHGHGRIINTH